MANMQSFVIGVVIVGITLVIGIFISAEVQDQMTENGSAYNAAEDLVEALAGGTAWITILVVVGFATIVLGMLTSGLGRAAEGGLGGPVY
jgi:hypothetical protein